MSKHEATGKKEQLKWTDYMDELFIQSMIAQQNKGYRINGTFTTQAYNNMIGELRTKLQIDVTKKHLKNRLKTLKDHFSQWYDMFRGTSMSGFSWNSETQLIEAEDEVWDQLIYSKPEAAVLKMKKISNFNEMLELFAKDRASGAQAETAKERNARLQKTDNINLETVAELDDLLAANEVILETQYNIDDDIQVLHPTSCLPDQSSSAKKCKTRKRKIEQQDEDLASMIMNSVGSVANAILEGNKIIQESNKILERAYHHEYTGEEIYNELKPMDLDSHEIPRVFNYLVANQAKARSLFSAPPEIRLGILRDMLGSSN
ncbi:putative Myb/SANT-like domain-containing protein [Helianthus annuus]|nr:putative Myb/SANT-like domain-containing protein [Helianthus annuus]